MKKNQPTANKISRGAGVWCAAASSFAGAALIPPVEGLLDVLANHGLLQSSGPAFYLPIVLPLLLGFYFLANRQWRAFQGLLLGCVALMILLVTGVYFALRNFSCCVR